MRKLMILLALGAYLLAVLTCGGIARICTPAGCTCPPGSYEGLDGICYPVDSTPDD